jgi:uncharacterized protein (DUF3820 family)
MNQSSDVIKFGKFKGTALVDLKHSYVRWLLTLENLDVVLGEKLRSLPWVKEEAERERKFQKRKAKAELFSKPCFQRTTYSSNQRIAYNNAKFNS